MKKPWYMTILYIILLDIVAVIGLLNADHWYIKLLFYALLGCGIAIRIVMADKRERSYSFSNKFNTQVSPFIEPWSLPLFVVVYSVLFLPIVGLVVTIVYFFSNFILVFFHISICNAVLLLLLPFLRKHFSSRVCATLWVLPSLLYIAFIPLVQKDRPLLIIHLPVTIGNWLALIWIFGFAGTLLYQIINHLLYRRKILKNAKRDWNVDLQRIWYDILANGRFKDRYYPVMRSAEVSTPLSIGLFKKTTCVILPQKEYTLEELRLILRHEAIHIARRDSSVKFFMVFCAAVCWFNPLTWISVRHCTADMELSCDETVLLGENDETKQRYAELLLKTAGNDRGFSTCLSASAKTLLYRLNHVLKPQKRFLGAFAAGIAMFLILSTFGLAAISYNPITGAELILNTEENVSWLDDVIYNMDGQRTEYKSGDLTYFHDYLSAITFYQLTGNYAYPDDTSRITIGYQKTDYKNDPSSRFMSNGVVELILEDHTLTIIDFATGGLPETKTYYHNADIDWEYLLSQATPIS